MTVSQFVITHKDVKRINNKKYICVNRKNCPNGFDFYDDTKDNISSKNPNYCELTALYWIYKNDNSDIISFEHYRRMFVTHLSPFSYHFLSDKKIEKYLNKYDIILPTYEKYAMSVKDYFVKYHEQKDLDNLRNIVKEFYPSYLKEFDEVMDDTRITHFNMVIAKKSFIDSYSAWLFDILFKLEKITDMTGYDTYQQRLYGFLSERLLNVYVRHNNIKSLHKPVINPLENSFKSYFKRLIRHILRKDFVR